MKTFVPGKFHRICDCGKGQNYCYVLFDFFKSYVCVTLITTFKTLDSKFKLCIYKAICMYTCIYYVVIDMT